MSSLLQLEHIGPCSEIMTPARDFSGLSRRRSVFRAMCERYTKHWLHINPGYTSVPFCFRHRALCISATCGDKLNSWGTSPCIWTQNTTMYSLARSLTSRLQIKALSAFADIIFLFFPIVDNSLMLECDSVAARRIDLGKCGPQTGCCITVLNILDMVSGFNCS